MPLKETQELYVIAHEIELVLGQAVREGLDRERLLEVVDLDEASFSDPDAHVPVQVLVRLWKQIVQRLDRPGVGLRMGEAFRLPEMGLIGYILLHSPDVRRALEKFIQLNDVVNQGVRVSIHVAGDRAEVRFDFVASLLDLVEPVGDYVSGTLSVIRELTRSPVEVLEARFPFPTPADTAEYRRIFRAPLLFEREPAALVIPAETLDRRVEGADEKLLSYLESLAEGSLKRAAPTRQSFLESVERAQWGAMQQGQASLANVAGMLGVSTRTLQRRLRDEGISFAELLEDLRRRTAMRLLRDPGIAAYEVSMLLGYSEPSTFFRAFRRWTGLTPQAYRTERAAQAE